MFKVGDRIEATSGSYIGVTGVVICCTGSSVAIKRDDGHGWHADDYAYTNYFSHLVGEDRKGLWWLETRHCVKIDTDINYAVKKFLLKGDKDFLVHYLREHP